MGVKILVVDDEPDLELLIRQKFRRQIRGQLFEFIFAANGVEALDILKKDEGINLVLTDINMPEMDGLTLLSRINDLNNLIKSVIISAYGDLENIRTAMNRGAFDFLTKPIDFKDLEITIQKTLNLIAELKRAIEDHNRLLSIQREMDIARNLQQSILPKRFTPFPEHDELDIHGLMIPAREVGGDFYDFFLIDREQLGFLIADVCGKGFPAALFMMMSRTIMKSQALLGLPPEECLYKVNNLLCADNPADMFVTMFYGVLNVRTGRLDYSSGGHNLPWIVRSGKGVEPCEQRGGTALGIFTDESYESGTYQLERGDGIFLYTDGVTEAESRDGRFFTDEKLRKTLEQLHEAPAEQLNKGVLEEVKTFCQGARQSDDITELTIRFK